MASQPSLPFHPPPWFTPRTVVSLAIMITAITVMAQAVSWIHPIASAVAGSTAPSLAITTCSALLALGFAATAVRSWALSFRWFLAGGPADGMINSGAALGILLFTTTASCKSLERLGDIIIVVGFLGAPLGFLFAHLCTIAWLAVRRSARELPRLLRPSPPTSRVLVPRARAPHDNACSEGTDISSGLGPRHCLRIGLRRRRNARPRAKENMAAQGHPRKGAELEDFRGEA